MGNVLVSLDEKHEALLRQLAQEKYGSKKGSVSAVVVEALDELKQKEKKEMATKQLLALMEKGFNLGFKGTAYKTRDELYEKARG